jgi:hypothetical protein
MATAADRPQLVVLHPDQADPGALPALGLPFATVIDARLESRTDPEALIAALLIAGCSFFACIGTRAEVLRELIDEVIEELGYLHVPTSCHGNAQTDDVVALLGGLEPACVFALVDAESPLARALQQAFG